MRVAAIQMTSGHDIDANLEAAGRFLAHAAGLDAKLAALPENFAFMASTAATSVPWPSLTARAASRTSLQTRPGASRYGSSAAPCRVRQDATVRVAAACLVYKSDGQRAARYDKIHLFDVDVPGSTESHRESAHTVAGRDPRVVETPAGKLGLAVCYDMRFPELFRVLSRQGADLFVVPSAFTVPTGAHTGKSVAGEGHREPVRADRAGAVGHASERA
jgi:nitrilase